MFRYRPNKKAHIVDDDESHTGGQTLCGITHDGDVHELKDNDTTTVLPKHIPNCQKCRAMYVKQILDSLTGDVTSLSEGDSIEYWTHNDPTDPSSSLCVRQTGRIVKTPPYTETYGDETHTIEGKYKVQTGANMYATARFSRIWRINEEEIEFGV